MFFYFSIPGTPEASVVSTRGQEKKRKGVLVESVL
jgi:hypothetical protein